MHEPFSTTAFPSGQSVVPHGNDIGSRPCLVLRPLEYEDREKAYMEVASRAPRSHASHHPVLWT